MVLSYAGDFAVNAGAEFSNPYFLPAFPEAPMGHT